RVQQDEVTKGLRKFKSFLLDFAAGVPGMAAQYESVIAELQDAMTLMTDLYAFIQQYQDQMEFADYIANMNHPGQIGQKNDAETRLYNQMDLALKASMICAEWDLVLQTFEQWVFPFSKEFQALLGTTDIPDYLAPS